MGERETIKKLDSLISINCPYELENTDFSGKSIIEDLKFDSVSLMQLVTDIEETFGVSLDETGSLLELLDSYDELLEFLVREGEICDE